MGSLLTSSETKRFDFDCTMLLPLLTILLFCSLGLAEQPVSKEKEVSGLCPDHWIDGTLSGLGCLYFNSSTTANWEEAANWCQHPDNDASLVEISSELQFDFVRGELIFLQENGITNHWWTGGTDLGREGSWFWIGSLALLNTCQDALKKHTSNFKRGLTKF